MNNAGLAIRKLTERALAKAGELPLVLLLESLVPVRRLRELARKFGLSPKGGFRLDKAPANVLAPLLAELRDGKQMQEVIELLVPAAAPEPEPEVAPPSAEQQALLALRDAEVSRLREDLERAREGQNRARDREAELQRRLAHEEQVVTALRRDLAHVHREPSAPGGPRDDRAVRELEQLVHDLENEREGFLAADEALRRQLAHNQSRLRLLELHNAELESLLPKGKRRHKPPPPPAAPEAEKHVRLPRFLPSFYKSLEGRDRRTVERAHQAILLFLTEGHAYPGLEVKQLGGQDTWSLRVSLGLRIYFRQLPDGDIELIELGDREDQNTTLRRLKER